MIKFNSPAFSLSLLEQLGLRM